MRIPTPLARPLLGPHSREMGREDWIYAIQILGGWWSSICVQRGKYQGAKYVEKGSFLLEKELVLFCLSSVFAGLSPGFEC